MRTVPFEVDDVQRITQWLGRTGPLDVSAHLIACPDEDTWLAERGKGIGASEVGVIVGASQWTSPYALWWRKKLGWRIPGTEAQRWGHLVEDPIAALFTEDMADTLYVAKPLGHPYSLWCHTTDRWVMCTPDRLAVTRDGEVVPVEIKSDEGGDGWGTPGTDEVPRQYRCQALWQAHVFGAIGTYIVRKSGSGRRRMAWYWVPFDYAELLPLRSAADTFLISVVTGDAPDPDGSKATTEALQELNAVQGETFTGVPYALYKEWHDARAAKRDSAARERWASNRLRAAMGTAEFATYKTSDGLDVVFAKRRVGKRNGYAVAATVVDELREIGGQLQAGDGVRPPDPQTGPADQEEGPPSSSSERGDVGGGEHAATGGEDPGSAEDTAGYVTGEM